jgi:hypothetical protein
MSARICSVCRATPLPPITAKPRTPNTTRLLLSTSVLSIRKRPFNIPLSNKHFIAAPSHSNFPELINPKQHYVYSKDLSVDGSAKSVSDLVRINTRDILSIMAVQELRNKFQRCKNGMTNFALVIEDHSSVGDMVGDEGNLDM